VTEWKSIDEVLDFAISEEEAAAEFYTGLAGRIERPWMRDVLEGFANEEQGHKARLLAVKAGGSLHLAGRPVADLRVADYLVDLVPGSSIGYREALVVAMKKEKAAFQLYTDLAESADDPRMKETFLALAQEEARHRLRFELEYDNLSTEN